MAKKTSKITLNPIDHTLDIFDRVFKENSMLGPLGLFAGGLVTLTFWTYALTLTYVSR